MSRPNPSWIVDLTIILMGIVALFLIWDMWVTP